MGLSSRSRLVKGGKVLRIVELGLLIDLFVLKNGSALMI